MKKIVLGVLLFLMMQGIVYGENRLSYSLMAAPLEENIYEIEEMEGMFFFSDVDLSSGTTLSWEEEFYNKLDSVYAPENIVNQSVRQLDSGKYYIQAPGVVFKCDDSLGTPSQQASLRISQIHEVYARYLQNNPEYFYLIPRQYGGSYKVVSGKLVVWFAPVIASNFPDFDGSKEALLAHDYIIDNCAYYRTCDENGKEYYGDGYSYNSYGILVNKKGVCQGLSYAYPCILKALGYGTENIRQIRSDEIQHMWNFVKLGDNWYHVDLTWDDPLYAYSGEEYDMTNESLQYEHHDHFLMSNETNAKKRVAKGYMGFTLEILGYNDSEYSLADDNSYESGYIFNDPVDNSLRTVPGRVEYNDGQYKKYHKNEDVYFLSDTLKAPRYLVSQITYNQYNVPMVWVLGSKQRTRPNETVTQYISYYEDGRFLKTIPVTQSLTGFGMVPVDDYVKPQNGQSAKIITVDSNFTPIANTPIMN